MRYNLPANRLGSSKYDQAKIIVANLWIARWPLQQDMFDVWCLIAVDRGELDVQMEALNILLDSIKLGVFYGLLFSAKHILISYYGALVCSSIITRKQVQTSYGDVVRSVPAQHFSTWSNKVSDTVSVCTEYERIV